MSSTSGKRINPSAKLQAGFGLVELLISISIMVLITSVVIARQDAFNSSTVLRNQAYEIALDVRGVQLQAVSASKLNDPSVVNSFRNVYGLYFAGGSNTYRIFQDAGTPGNNWYSANEEYGKQGYLDKRFEISEVRTMIDAAGTPADDVTVMFQRPNFDARFFTAANSPVDADVTGIEIDVRVRGGTLTRTVEISKAGQITVR